MTSQEARQQIDACERQIIGTYSYLQDVARNIGSSAAHVASNNTTAQSMLPLIISLFGLFLCCVSHPVWGVLLIFAGFFFVYLVYDSAASVQRAVENQQKNLNSILHDNAKI